MVIACSHAQAQTLVDQFLDVLLAQAPVRSKLSLSSQCERWGRPVPRATWINVPMLRDDESVEVAAARAAQVRALMEVVGQLSYTSALQWVDFYDAFWKPVLISPIRQATRSGELGATAFDCIEQLERTRAPKFMLDFAGDVASTANCLELLEAFCFAKPDRVVSEPHRSVLTSLLSRIGANTAAPRVEVGICLSNAIASLSMLQKLPRVLKRIADFEPRASVHLEITTLWIPGLSVTDALTIDALAEIVACEKLAVRHVRIKPLFFSSKCVPLEAFQAFVYRTLSVKSLCSTMPSLETLVFERPAFTHGHVASICSALRSSSHLKEVHLAVRADTESNMVAVVWAWIAFGILDPDADARLDRLCIGEIAVRDEDVAVVRRILSSSTPGKDLWELEHGELPIGDGFEHMPVPAHVRAFVRVGVNAAIRMQPIVHCHVLVPTVLDTNEFEAVILLAAWTCIVVPGLDGLNLPCHRITADDLSDILASCPNLTRLNITGNQIDDLSPLVTRYRARKCKISSLGFRSFSASAHVVTQVTDLLVEPYATPLRYLNVECPRGGVHCDAFARALQASRHCALRVLDLYAPSSAGSDAIAESIRCAIESPREARMRSSTKTAFLSVVCHEGEMMPSTVKQLDSAVVSIIFSFAATAVPRVFIWHTTS